MNKRVVFDEANKTFSSKDNTYHDEDHFKKGATPRTRMRKHIKERKEMENRVSDGRFEMRQNIKNNSTGR